MIVAMKDGTRHATLRNSNIRIVVSEGESPSLSFVAVSGVVKIIQKVYVEDVFQIEP